MSWKARGQRPKIAGVQEDAEKSPGRQGGQEGAEERKREERLASVRQREGRRGRALLQLVGCSAVFALGRYAIPGRRSGPSRVGQQHPLTGSVALLGWTCPPWPCCAEEAA